jgi:5-methylcytosine-specific restriction endonuclease McrA
MIDNKYKQYLQSKEWLQLRLDILTLRPKCEKCGYGKNLQVHHLHYKNIFKEEPSDLMVLCNKCHLKEHGLHNKKRAVKVKLTLEQKVKLKAKKKAIKKKNKFRLKKKYGII